MNINTIYSYTFHHVLQVYDGHPDAEHGSVAPASSKQSSKTRPSQAFTDSSLPLTGRRPQQDCAVRWRPRDGDGPPAIAAQKR